MLVKTDLIEGVISCRPDDTSPIKSFVFDSVNTTFAPSVIHPPIGSNLTERMLIVATTFESFFSSAILSPLFFQNII